jgi:hypothetical protein
MSCNTWMIRGSLRTPDRLLELSGLHVQLLEVWKTMVDTYGPYDIGGSAIAGIRPHTLDLQQHYL